MRVCDKDTGKAIWVTKESADKIEDTTAGARRRNVVEGTKTGEGVGDEAKDAEIKRLEEENMKLRSEALKQTGEGAGNEGNDAEMKRLKEEIMTLSEALTSEKEDSVKGKDIRRLEEEFMKLLEALKREKGAAGGNGSEGMSSSTKLRQTVLAERRGCFGGLLWG
jgi:hypothetical protein